MSSSDISVAQRAGNFFAKFAVLRDAMRELWIMFSAKILCTITYTIVNCSLILWLSQDLNFGDVSAGLVVTAWSIIMTATTIIIGSLVDTIGIRRSMVIGFIICLITRGIMTFCSYPWLAISAGLMPLAIGEAMMTPVIVAGIKKYSTKAQRAMAFSIFYAMMNIGIVISGLCFDGVRNAMGEHGTLALPGGISLSTYQILIFIAFLCTIPNLLSVIFGMREGAYVDNDDKIIFESEKNSSQRATIASLVDCLKSWVVTFKSLWSHPNFYRFLTFLAIMVCVRMIFYHFSYTFPKYAIRELGEGAPIGRLYSVLNPILVIFLSPFIAALSQKYSAYKVMIWGSLISATSVFFLAFPANLYDSLAHGILGNLICNTWLGLNVAIDDINPLYIAIFLTVTIFSIGESFYSPRFYEYISEIAPKGQEASYMSLSMLPYLVAKFFVGLISGSLLATFCPVEGPHSSGSMWAIIGIIALFTPICLIALNRYICKRK